MRQPSSETATVELILATGSNAGIRASIYEGFYMIGRHQECQIRPKSRSVSRRHSLIHYAAGIVRVLDLQSTTGTIVNASRLEPRIWRTLKDGDQIRCGKVVFQLSLAGVGEVDPVAGRVAAKDSLATGAAWHDFDVVGFLAAEDEADREERYSRIRGGGRIETGKSDTDTKIESLADTLADEGAPSSIAKNHQDKASGKRSPKKPSSPLRVPKTKRPRKGRSLPNLSLRLDSTDQLKLFGAILFTIAVIGYAGYQIHQFSSPTSTRAVEELNY